MAQIFDKNRYWENFANDQLVGIMTDGSWIVKTLDNSSDRKVVRTETYSLKEYEEKRDSYMKEYKAVGFKDYRVSGNKILFYDDWEHELVSRVREISKEDFESFGKTWTWDVSGEHLKL